MECRPLEIKLISATDLKDVNLVSTMDAYAVVSILSDAFYIQKLKTPVLKDSGPNPYWNHYSLKFKCPEIPLQHNLLTLQIKVFSNRRLGDREIGGVEISLKELLVNLDDEKREKELSYCVILPKGKGLNGTINFSCKFGDKCTAPETTTDKKVSEPVMAYPTGKFGSSQVYPPQQSAYFYQPPPPTGYPTYPAAGYGKPQKPMKRGMGSGVGLGLGAGLLGGLLIGDMMCGVGEMAAYGAGFYDAGFNFELKFFFFFEVS